MFRKICTSLLLSSFSLVAAVGPDITARDRLVKDLPNGVFAGKKLTPKVMNKNTKNNPMILFQSDERTVIDMHLSAKSIDLDFKSGVFKMSGMMSLEWRDLRLINHQFYKLIIFSGMFGIHLNGTE